MRVLERNSAWSDAIERCFHLLYSLFFLFVTDQSLIIDHRSLTERYALDLLETGNWPLELPELFDAESRCDTSTLNNGTYNVRNITNIEQLETK